MRRVLRSPALLALIAGIAVTIIVYFFGGRSLYLESNPDESYLTLSNRDAFILSALEGMFVTVVLWILLKLAFALWSLHQGYRRS